MYNRIILCPILQTLLQTTKLVSVSNVAVHGSSSRPNTHIEAGFYLNLKTGVVFVYLTTAYDTVWRKGTLYKLTNVIICPKTTNLINNVLTYIDFKVALGDEDSKNKPFKID